MAEVNWILKLGTHRSPYLHSQPPTSPLYLPNHTGWMSLWDRQSAHCTYGPLLLHRSLTTVGFYSRRGSGWQGASVTFSLGSFAGKHSGLILSQFYWSRSLSLSDCCSVSFLGKAIPLSSPRPRPPPPPVAIFESSDGLAVSVPSWNKLTLSPPRLVLSTWWERRQRTFLHSWVLDAALITTPETETWSLSVCSCLCFAQSSSHSFFFFCLSLSLFPCLLIRAYLYRYYFLPKQKAV